MIRWFADLPIERKLRVVITVPAMAAFAIAIVMQVATNLLHVRADMQQRAGGISRAAGVGTIEALRLGETSTAINALSTLGRTHGQRRGSVPARWQEDRDLTIAP